MTPLVPQRGEGMVKEESSLTMTNEDRLTRSMAMCLSCVRVHDVRRVNNVPSLFSVA